MALFKYPQTTTVTNPEPHTEFWSGIQTPITTAIKEADIKTTNEPYAEDYTFNLKEALVKSIDRNTTVAVKYDDNKTDWSLVPFESLEGMVKVLEFGAKKYAGWNWTNNGGFSYTRVLRSCLRHIFAYMRGEDNDPESGLSHIHHAMCNLLFISHYIGNKEKFNKDDRHIR